MAEEEEPFPPGKLRQEEAQGGRNCVLAQSSWGCQTPASVQGWMGKVSLLRGWDGL